jgi:post-segregation antitoxin (ccd killing protein)
VTVALIQTSVKVESWQLEAAKLAKLNLSHLLRTAIDAALNSNNDLEKEEAEIQRQKAILAAREEMLSVKKQRKVRMQSLEFQDTHRKNWLHEHSNFMEAYRKGAISSKGWQTLLRELNFTSRKKTEEFLQQVINERDEDRCLQEKSAEEK